MHELISVENLSLCYPSQHNFQKQNALTDISFKLYKGESLAVIGLNGSGKSTLLQAVAGILPHNRGRISVNGKLSTILQLGLGMQMELSGRKNIYLIGMSSGLSKKEIDELIPEIINYSELEEFIDHPIRSYSKGMVMKLCFSITTSLQPEIVLLDEWIGAGDAKFKHKASHKVEAMLENSSGFMIASHNSQIVRKYCQTAIWLDKGALRMHGDVEQVLLEFEKFVSNRP